MLYTILHFERLLNQFGYSYTVKEKKGGKVFLLENKNSGEVTPFMWRGKPRHELPPQFMEQIIKKIIK